MTDLTFNEPDAQLQRRWMAVCDCCHASMADQDYQAAEIAAGPDADPRCTRCDRSLWSFHPMD